MVRRTVPLPFVVRRSIVPFLFGAFTILILVGCDSDTVSVLDRETLFQMEIGRLEDQLDLITRSGVLPTIPTSIVMQEGFVYIGNGPANKVMEFSSFGDLVRLIYDPLENPEPITLGTPNDTDPSTGRTRHATEYSFGDLGVIAVDSRRRIYAVDRLSPERTVLDKELGVQLNRIVVRFGAEGQPLDYIGQEGIGGTPFPYIERLRVTVRDELAIVAKTMNARFFYLFSAEGELMYIVRIGLDRLPIPESDTDLIAVLEEMVPGVDAYRFYLKISYYRTAVDEETGKEFGVGFDHSRVYWLDLESGRYEGYFEVPRQPGSEEGTHFELIGTTREEYSFLTSRIDAGQTRLLIINDEGRVVRRRNIYTPENELVVREFTLSPTGVLTALFGYVDRAEVVWWRADRLIEVGTIRGDADAP